MHGYVVCFVASWSVVLDDARVLHTALVFFFFFLCNIHITFWWISGANPRYPLISELRNILIDSYYGRPYVETWERIGERKPSDASMNSELSYTILSAPPVAAAAAAAAPVDETPRVMANPKQKWGEKKKKKKIPRYPAYE